MKQEEDIDEGALLFALLIVLLGVLSMIPWVLMALFISKFCLLGCLIVAVMGYLLVRGAKLQNDHEDKIYKRKD